MADSDDSVQVPTSGHEPFGLGVMDGMEHPFYLGMGRTWTFEDCGDPHEKNEVYDLGVNVGQNIMRLLMGGL